jgi:hypothetical protein
MEKPSGSQQQDLQLSTRCVVYCMRVEGAAAAEVVQCVDSTPVMARTGERIVKPVRSIVEASRSAASVASDVGAGKTGDLRVKLDR